MGEQTSPARSVGVTDFRFDLKSLRSNIHIWSFTGETISILTGHLSFIYSIVLLPDGDLASSGEDHTVRIWRGQSPASSSEPRRSVFFD